MRGWNSKGAHCGARANAYSWAMTTLAHAIPAPAATEASAIPPGSRVYLIDGSGYIFRAFHALPPLTRPSDGLPVGAVPRLLQHAVEASARDQGREAPTHLAVIFDHSRESFRNAISANTRRTGPSRRLSLIPQFSLVREATRAFGVACVEQEGLRGRRYHRHLCPRRRRRPAAR